MQNKIATEGKEDEATFDKFMCYCQTGASDLEDSIKDAETKVPQLDSSIKESIAAKEQLEADLVQHKKDRIDAKEALGKASALRNKEAGAFAKESSDDNTNIAALAKAIAALEKGVTGFLQTSTASVLQHLTVDMDLTSSDRDTLSSFLSQSQGDGYAPQSGEIIGILKQMKETMEKGLADATTAENAAIKSYEGIVAAKEKEIAVNTHAIEDKLQRHGDISVKIETLKEDLDDTSKALTENKKFLADLAGNCETKKKDWELVKKTRAEELLAIAETIQLLNSDEALDLFKKTLPTPSLLQMKVTTQQMRTQALSALRSARSKHHVSDARIDFIVMALHGRKATFEKVISMIDNMVALLSKEQSDDVGKKKYCLAEIDQTEDKGKELDLAISDLRKVIEDMTGTVGTLSEEIAALENGIKALDAQVVEATQLRKTEHEHYKSTLASNTATKDLLGLAKNRLNKFYSPKLYKEAPKRELSEEESVVLSMGGTLAPTSPPGGISGTGITYMQIEPALVQVSMHENAGASPPPPPEAVGAYMTQRAESVGVIQLIDMLIADVDKERQEMEVEEKDSQVEYEQFVADSAAKRTADAKSISLKEGAKADLQAKIEKTTAEKKSKIAEAMSTARYLGEVHITCDWLLQNFEVRKSARAAEVDSLNQAKAVLSGADYSLLQRTHSHIISKAS